MNVATAFEGGPIELGVVIVTHNSAQHLPVCLAALDLGPGCEVLVIDNASSDATVDLVRAQPFIHLVCNTRNLGYTRAANQGAGMLQARFLCFLNPDCEIPPGFLAQALAVLRQEPDICLIPAALVQAGTFKLAKRPGYTRRRLLLDIFEGNYRHLPGGRALAAWVDDPSWHWPHGACFLLSNRLFRDLGGLDPDYPMYMVDVDFGRRLHTAGYGIFVLGQAVVHHEGEGAAISRHEHLRLLNEGRFLYAGKTYGAWFESLLRGLAWPGYHLRGVLGTGR